MKKFLISAFVLSSAAVSAQPKATLHHTTYHVSINGDDHNNGSLSKPLRTISGAANLAMPGDTVLVHAGIYREQITPPRGGNSNSERIVYEGVPGEKVVIKGTEIIKGWKKIRK